MITDQKLLNIDRGIPVLDARFNQTGDTSPFQPTPQVSDVKEFNHSLSVTCSKEGEGVYTSVPLQQDHDYMIKYEIKKNDPIIQVTIKDASETVYKELLTKSGKYNDQFSVNTTGDYTLKFSNYKDTEKPTGYTLDNIQIIDITGIDAENVLANSDNMAIFVPSVLSFNDYYPYGMLMPNRHASSNKYRYGFQSLSRERSDSGDKRRMMK